MVKLIINWRRNMLAVMLLLLFITSLGSQNKHLCLGWQVEHQRLSSSGLLIIRRSVTVPVRHFCLNYAFQWLRIKFVKDSLILLAYKFLFVIGIVWMKIFRKIISKMINDRIGDFHFELNGTVSVEKDTFVIKAGVMISQVPDRDSIYENDFVLINSEQAVEKLILSPYAMKTDEIKPAVATFKSDSWEQPNTLLYDKSVREEMKKFYTTLSEKDRRRYAGIESRKLGYGGIISIACLSECDKKTVTEGIRDLKDLSFDIVYDKRIRKTGGGRKPYHVIHPGIDNKFLDVIKDNIAGDPMKGGLWTNLSYEKIAQKLNERHGVKVSTKVVRQLKKKHKFGRRKAQKRATMKQIKNRNAQFENIARIKAEYQKTCVIQDSR